MNDTFLKTWHKEARLVFQNKPRNLGGQGRYSKKNCNDCIKEPPLAGDFEIDNAKDVLETIEKQGIQINEKTKVLYNILIDQEHGNVNKNELRKRISNFIHNDTRGACSCHADVKLHVSLSATKFGDREAEASINLNQVYYKRKFSKKTGKEKFVKSGKRITARNRETGEFRRAEESLPAFANKLNEDYQEQERQRQAKINQRRQWAQNAAMRDIQNGATYTRANQSRIILGHLGLTEFVNLDESRTENAEKFWELARDVEMKEKERLGASGHLTQGRRVQGVHTNKYDKVYKKEAIKNMKPKVAAAFKAASAEFQKKGLYTERQGEKLVIYADKLKAKKLGHILATPHNTSTNKFKNVRGFQERGYSEEVDYYASINNGDINTNINKNNWRKIKERGDFTSILAEFKKAAGKKGEIITPRANSAKENNVQQAATESLNIPSKQPLTLEQMFGEFNDRILTEQQMDKLINLYKRRNGEIKSEEEVFIMSLFHLHNVLNAQPNSKDDAMVKLSNLYKNMDIQDKQYFKDILIADNDYKTLLKYSATASGKTIIIKNKGGESIVFTPDTGELKIL